MSDDVLVIGDVMVDVIVVPSGPLEYGSDTPASIRSVGGGSAANTACWLAALGQSVRLAAAVGDDAMGHGAIAGLEAAGVVWAGSVDDLRPTGACVVLVDGNGERTMLPDRGANDALPVATVEAAIADRPTWVHLSGYALLDEGSRPAALAAIAAATAADVPVSVDASSAAPLRRIGGDRFLDWVAGVRILFANDEELAALGGVDAAAARCEIVVAKHGADGSSWIEAGERWSVPAVRAVVVDTVGAGDAHDAGVIDAVLRGLTPHAALEAASAIAARAVSTAGARP